MYVYIIYIYIYLIDSTTNRTILAKPSKIVAGLEVTKTLELLLAIVYGIEIKVFLIFIIITIIKNINSYWWFF